MDAEPHVELQKVLSSATIVGRGRWRFTGLQQTCNDLVHSRQDVMMHRLLQHQAMRQVVDVLRGACKMCELQHLHACSDEHLARD